MDWLGGALIAFVALVSATINVRWDDPPRFDGAGYAVLAKGLESGRGYREIDHPDAPRHAHFPPGYPLALAALWRSLGISIPAAHLASVLCSTLASFTSWAWFKRLYPPRVAFLLGSAVAVNWSWGRIGGSIQSEPLFLLLQMLALLATSRIESSPRSGHDLFRGLALGVLLGACILTRHVGACMAVAVQVDLVLRRRSLAAISSGALTILIVVPWAAWVASVGHGSQVGLLPTSGFGRVVAENGLFYIRRIPDLLVGPLVEVGTVFLPRYRVLATAAAIVVTAVVAFGWWKASRTPGRRLASLVGGATLGLLLVWPFTEAGRFLIPMVPILLVGALEGLARLLGPLRTLRPKGLAAAILLAVSLPYPIYAVAAGRADASRRTHADFDLACAAIAADIDLPGPVLGRHPGEIYWQTGRCAISPREEDAGSIGRLIDRYGVAFLLVDDVRFAGAPISPLGRFARDHPDRVGPARRFGSVEIFPIRRSLKAG